MTLWKRQLYHAYVVSDYVDDCRLVSSRVTRSSANYELVMTASSAPSAIRVFGKSMYLFSVGWVAAVGWLWVAEVQQHLLRRGVPPPNYAMDTAGGGIAPAALIALCGILINRWAGRAPTPALQRREWWHAFWWALVPNALLFVTVWVMIQEAR